jgi:hypothetical protein
LEKDTNKMIAAAEHEIANVLRTLETDTGMVLDTIDVTNIEVTVMTDDRPQWLRRLNIEMKRLPETKWDQGKT